MPHLPLTVGFIISVLLCTSVLGNTVPKDPFDVPLDRQSVHALALADQLESPTTLLPVYGLDRKRLRQFYARRSYALAWFDSEKPKPHTLAFLHRLATVRQEGLDPNDYHLTTIQNYWPVATAEQATWLDLLLTDAFFRMALDLSSGTLDPARADPRWYINPPTYDPVEALQTAIRTNTVTQHLLQLAPGHQAYQRLRLALEDLRKLASEGGWHKLPSTRSYEPGSAGKHIRLLRERLRQSGDLPQLDSAADDYFDASLTNAVKRVQTRHGLRTDGIVGPQTLTALNIPVNQRIEQIELTMERWRWLPRDLGRRYLMVNMAGFELSAVEDDQLQFSMRVIVGRKYRSTPTFHEQLSSLVFNPYWHVPPRIARLDLLPKQVRNPAFMKTQGIRVFDTWQHNASELSPENIDWQQLESQRLPYKLRQDPGPQNALGRIKFMLPNRFKVYLHDTPAKHLFERPVRTFSSGCIRVEDPARLAAYALNDPANWDENAVLDVMDASQTRTVRLKSPVPVYIVYLTTWVDGTGTLQFRNDIYGRDLHMAEVRDRTHDMLQQANAGRTPPVNAIR